jgi:hypothetical protein
MQLQARASGNVDLLPEHLDGLPDVRLRAIVIVPGIGVGPTVVMANMGAGGTAPQRSDQERSSERESGLP